MAKESTAIKMDILDHLTRDSRIKANKIKVEVQNGSAILSGSVQSYSAREAAESDCWSVAGVVGVENNLEVVFPSNYQRPSDNSIQESLKRLLSWDPDLYLEKINSYVSEGRVFLEGIVDELWKRHRAEELVYNVGGVIEIVNKIAVSLRTNVTDEKIGMDIVNSIHRNLLADVNKIGVEVINSRVILSGTVSNRDAFDTVEDIARYTHGVGSVENRMVIVYTN